MSTMPKKKQPRNAFFFFMIEYKGRCERNGESFPNGFRDVQEPAGLEWSNMSAEQRLPFEKKAKAEKEAVKGDSSRKETCWHNSFHSIDKKREEEEMFKETMYRYLETKFNTLCTRKRLLQEQTWYLIHVNYFCIYEGELHHPAEIAIAQFSLEKGVIDVYHTVVHATIQLGYRHDAEQRSNTYHRIPVDNNGGQIIYDIRDGIKRFLQMERVKINNEEEKYRYPPLYSMEDDVNQNYSMSAIKSLFNSLALSGAEVDTDLESVVIYPLDKLFMELKDATSKLAHTNSFPSPTVAFVALEKDLFKWTPEIACDFHQENDNVEYCSKSYVQRWVFTICDHCCEDLEIPLVKGRHVALNSDTNFQRRAKEEEARKPAPVRTFTMVDHSKLNQPKPSSSSYAYDRVPLPRPQRPVNPALLADRPDPPPFDQSEDSFPAIPIANRGRGRVVRGWGRGGYAQAPQSFADAMKNKK